MKNNFPIHIFLFAEFPVLFLFSHNINQTSASEIIIPSAVVLGVTFLLTLILRLIVKDLQKTGMIVSLLLILSFSYGHVYNVIQGWQVGAFTIGRHTFLHILWGILLVIGVYRLVKTSGRLHNFTKILNVASASLVIISLSVIIAYKLQNRASLRDLRSVEEIAADTLRSGETRTAPDIYYIILDRYANNNTLKEVFNYDNSELLDYLSSRGFYVASDSRSNYLKTLQSLASSLNMEYINYLSEKIGEDSDNLLPLYAMLRDYKVWRFLKSRGYVFIHFGSFWHATTSNAYADMNFNIHTLSEFSRLLYNTTIIPHIACRLHTYDVQKMQWERVRYKFDKLAEMPDIEEPTFVFVHMLLPHEPYVFDRDGSYTTVDEVNKRSRTTNYVNQLIYTNKRIKQLVDRLLSSPGERPIIILQGDEGTYPRRYRIEFDNFDWRKASRAELKEKVGILNAYYLPGVDTDALYPSISPVNSFRLVFNLYFGTDLELLPDECYAFEDNEHPYRLFKITDKVR